MSGSASRVAWIALGIVPLVTSPRAINGDAIAGEWLAVLTTSNVSDFRVYMTFRRTGADRYEAFSRPGALRQFISWRQYAVGRVLGKLPPHLAAVRFDSVSLKRDGDTVIVRGKLVSQMLGPLRLFGSLRGDTVRADLRFDSTSASAGQLQAVRTPDRRPLRDYASLARGVADTMRAYVFNPRLMDTPAWRGMFTELSRRLASAQDDADVMASFFALLPRLGTSHIALTHDPRLATMSVDSALMRVSAPPESLVTLTFPAPGVAQLWVRRWERVSTLIDTAFARIDSARAHTLIFDIRANPGGDQTGLTAAGHLFSDSMYAGVLLGNGWYRDHAMPPTLEQLRMLPRSTRDDLLNTFHMLRDQGAVVAFVPPRQPRFLGKVFLVTNGRTGSASEPLAYALKRTGRATLVGERTAGAILAAVPHPVGDGWILVLPEGDYYAADGVRLEARGVEPDVKISLRDAYLPIADTLRARHPYAAALLAALSYSSNVTRADQAERGSLAEHWAREASRLGPDSIAPIAALASAFITQERWEAGFAILDSLLARGANPQAVRYQIGRMVALSGQRLTIGEEALRTYVRGTPPAGAPSRATAFWRLGMILEKKGDTVGARRAYAEGLALEPRNGNLIAAARRLDGGGER